MLQSTLLRDVLIRSITAETRKRLAAEAAQRAADELGQLRFAPWFIDPLHAWTQEPSKFFQEWTLKGGYLLSGDTEEDANNTGEFVNAEDKLKRLAVGVPDTLKSRISRTQQLEADNDADAIRRVFEELFYFDLLELC